MSAAAAAVIGTLATLFLLRRDIHTNSFIFANAFVEQNAGLPVTKADILEYLAPLRTFGHRAVHIRSSQNVSVRLPRNMLGCTTAGERCAQQTSLIM
jgi:hypothetical protein